MVDIVRLTEDRWNAADMETLPLFTHENLEIGILVLPPGERLPEEGYSKHENNEEYAYIISGEVIFTTKEDTFNLQGGDLMYNAKGTPHYTTNDSNVPAKLLWILSPGRK